MDALCLIFAAALHTHFSALLVICNWTSWHRDIENRALKNGRKEVKRDGACEQRKEDKSERTQKLEKGANQNCQLKTKSNGGMNYASVWLEGRSKPICMGRRCQTDTTSIYLYSDLPYISHSSAKTNSVTEKDSGRLRKTKNDYKNEHVN